MKGERERERERETRRVLSSEIVRERSRGWIDGEVASRFGRISVRMKRYSSVSGSRSYVSASFSF